MERDGILGDLDAPEEFITEFGIDKYLERASDYLDFLYMEKKKLSEKKTNKGFVAWFDRQETAVKAALIAAIVSFFGSLMSVVVATIRRRG